MHLIDLGAVYTNTGFTENAQTKTAKRFRSNNNLRKHSNERSFFLFSVVRMLLASSYFFKQRASGLLLLPHSGSKHQAWHRYYSSFQRSRVKGNYYFFYTA